MIHILGVNQMTGIDAYGSIIRTWTYGSWRTARLYWRDNHTKETENIAIEIDREMK